MDSERRELERVPLAYIEPRQVQWLVPGLIPLRTLTLVAGVGGLGKSTWLAGVAARVSCGDLLDGPADVLLVSLEDSAAEVLRPRVEAAQGDLARVHEVTVSGPFGGIECVRLPEDATALERLVRETAAKLIVVDPVVAAIDVAYDAHKDQHVRAVLAQLALLSERAGCAVALVAHLNKAPSRDAYIRIGGSVAFWNAARSVVLIVEDPDEPESGRLIAQRKSNYSRLKPVERHRIEEVILPKTCDPDTGEPIVTSRMVFVEVADEVDGADLLAPREEGEERPREADALRFLLGALGDGEWHDSREIKERAAACGLTERTLKRAKADLGVEHTRSGRRAETVTRWRLAKLGQGAPKGVAQLGLAEKPHGCAVSGAPSQVGPQATGVAPLGPTSDDEQGEAA